MSYEFIKELSEARLFRNPTKFTTKTSMSQMADSFFNAVMGLQILRHTDPKLAQRYAAQTMQNNLQGWRSSGSDLHNMAQVLMNPNNFADKIAMDRVISVPQLQLRTYLRNIAQGKEDANFDRKFLFNLQKGLRVSSPGLKNARRLIGDWSLSTGSERQLAATRVYLGMQHELRATDMWVPFSKNIKKKKLLLPDAELPEQHKMPLWQKVAIAGVAGYAIGKKLATV